MSCSIDFRDRRSSWCGARCNGALLDMTRTFQGQISETALPRAAGGMANSDGGDIYVTVSDKHEHTCKRSGRLQRGEKARSDVSTDPIEKQCKYQHTVGPPT